MASFSKEQIERIAHSFQAHQKTMSSKHNAWMATLRQYPDLHDLSSDEKKHLLFDVEKFIKDQELLEKSAKKETGKETSTGSIQETTEIKHPYPTTTKESWGIGRGLPPEKNDDEDELEPEKIITKEIHEQDHEEIFHEPDPHSESFLNNNTEIKYVSKTVLREQLLKEHEEDIARRWGPKLK